MPWTFELFDEKFHERQLTLDDYIRLEERLGVGWQQIHPLNKAKHAKNIAALMYAERTQIPFDDALTKVGQVAALAFVECIELVPDEEEPEPDPPVAGDPSKT